MFLMSIILGIALTLSYDLIRVFRRIRSHNSVLMAMEDVCFWLVWTYAVLDCIHCYGDGMLHWYMALGLLLGVVACHYTISCVFMKGADYILWHLKKWAKNSKKLLKKSDRGSKM